MKNLSLIFLIFTTLLFTLSVVSAEDDLNEIESAPVEIDELEDINVEAVKESPEKEVVYANESSAVKEDDSYNPQHIPDNDPRYTQVKLDAKDLKTDYKSAKTFDVKLTSKYGITYGVKDKISLKDAKIKLQVKVNGKWKTYTQLTNSNGVAKFKLTSLPAGKYEVKFSCNDQNFESSTYKATLTITKAKPKVSAAEVVKEYGKKGTFKITVKDANKKAIKNLKLKVKVYTGKKAKTYTLKTNSKGQATISTKKLKTGIHKVVISSANSNYKISKKSSITIGKKKTMTLNLNQQKDFSNGDFFHFFKLTKDAEDDKGVYVKNLRVYKGSLMGAKTHFIVKVTYTFKNIKGNTIIKTSTSNDMSKTKLIVGYEPVKAKVTYLQA